MPSPSFAERLESWMADEQAGRYASVADLLMQVLEQSGYMARSPTAPTESQDRVENLQELRSVAAQYTQGMPDLEPGQTPLGRFLEEVALVSDADQIDEGAGAVTLLTLHTAKGLEFPVVFIVGLEEGILPHSRSLESANSDDPEDMAEERRLFYVGVTRAKRRLYLIHCLQRSLWGDSSMQTPSRFLEEIPTDLLSGMVGRQQRRDGRHPAHDQLGRRQRTRSPSAAPPAATGRGAPSRRRCPARPPAGTGRAVYGVAGESGSQLLAAACSSRAAAQKPQSRRIRRRRRKFKRRDSVQHAILRRRHRHRERSDPRRRRGDRRLSRRRHQEAVGRVSQEIVGRGASCEGRGFDVNLAEPARDEMAVRLRETTGTDKTCREDV
jgi:hypothetical protein